MMKHEFEERVGVEISDREYELIETVYTWHPAISEAGGKDQIATLYKTGGMPLIKSCLLYTSTCFHTTNRKISRYTYIP